MGAKQPPTDDLTEVLADIGATDVTSLDDKAPMVIDNDGEVKPLAEAIRNHEPNWMDLPNEAVRDLVELRGKNRATLLEWVSANLVDGTDYGEIKGKNSLWKAGAEKICGMLGLQVHWPDLQEEIARLRYGDSEIVFLTCELLRGHVVAAQGAGARGVNKDGGDWNKAIKMAKKSAMIDAVLNVAGLSEVFTQDLEDMEKDRATLSERSQEALKLLAVDLFADMADDVLASLARRRFHIGDGDWTKIPSYRLGDAMRSLEEKAEAES